jgi:hypothetical protein
MQGTQFVELQASKDAEKLLASLSELPSPMARPVLVVVVGLPGTGKSYFSRRLVEQVPMLILETDTLRRVLFPEPSYSASESARLFRACHLLIRNLLKKGIPLVFDATNLVEAHREHIYHIADQLGVKLVLVSIEAPPEVVYERLKRRVEGADPQDHSTADWTVYRRMQSSVDPIRRRHFVVDSSRDISPAIAKVVREIKRWMHGRG